MTKDELALAILRLIFKDNRSVKSFNDYQCIRNYFSKLSMEDLLVIASQYVIECR